MSSSATLAHRFREVFLNGTWVANTNYKDQLSQTNWQQATRKIGDLNTIALLASHVNYYIAGIVQVLEGGPLEIRDKYSFDFAPPESQADWDKVRDKFFEDAERFATLVESMSDDELQADFAGKKYGSYQRNIDAMIEHGYYHLGQISLLRKMVAGMDF